MSGEFKDALGVCNVKMRKSLTGAKRGSFSRCFGLQALASSDSNFFFMASMLMLNLAVVNTFWPITSRSRLVHGCIHGPCLSPWILTNTAWSLLALLVDDL